LGKSTSLNLKVSYSIITIYSCFYWYKEMPGSRLFNRLREDFSILQGNLLVLVISWIFFYFAGSMVYPYESLYLQALGVSPFMIGLIGSLGTTILCISRIPGAYIADRYGRRRIIVVMTYRAGSFIYFSCSSDRLEACCNWCCFIQSMSNISASPSSDNSGLYSSREKRIRVCIS